uniref:Uncharacterized protein n=1 Tax=Anguilla anguilla TaxID=7936 RepID=A0A0E9VLA4_ANGAN
MGNSLLDCTSSSDHCALCASSHTPYAQ